jgi:hypothetical protein
VIFIFWGPFDVPLICVRNGWTTYEYARGYWSPCNSRSLLIIVYVSILKFCTGCVRQNQHLCNLFAAGRFSCNVSLSCVTTKCEAHNYHKWSLSVKKNRKKLRFFLPNQQPFSVQVFPKLRVCSTVLLIICRLDSLFKRKIYSAEKIRLDYSSLFRIYFHNWKHVDYFVKCETWHPKCLLSTHVLHFRIRISLPPPHSPIRYFLIVFFPCYEL